MIRKKDILLIVILLLAACGGLFVIRSLQKDTGGEAVITIDGSVYGTYSLNKNQTIEIDDEMGYNVVVIKDGKVYMEDADCPDRYCVQHNAIGYNHETIVCLPHKLVVEISGGESGSVDAAIN